MLESIKNAVKKFIAMGILSIEKKQIKKTVFKTYIHVTKAFQDDNKVEEVFNGINFYLPYSSSADLHHF
jgi:hypothetical protein